MNAKQMIFDLLKCFSPPPQAMQDKMERLAESISEDARQDVIDKIVESKDASKKLSAKDIVEACQALGVAYHATHYLPAEDWICDGCGRKFKYHACPSDDDRVDKDIFDFCPDCGLQPYYTKLAQSYNELGIATPWYERILASCAMFGPNKPSQTIKIMDLTLTRGGVFWSRIIADRERREEKKIAIDAKMASLDKAKRWDLQDV